MTITLEHIEAEHLRIASMIEQFKKQQKTAEYCVDGRAIPLRVALENTYSALAGLLNYAERQVCTHENTHRGGAIWEICDDCGMKWADDRGGKPKFRWPKEIVAARSVFNALAPIVHSAGVPDDLD